MSKEVPSANIAFNETHINEMIEISHLKLKHKIYGTWANRANIDLFDFQDILVFEKE